MLANSRAIHLGGNVRLYIRSQQNTLYRSRTSFFPRHSSTIVEPTPPFQRARTFLRYTGYASLSTVFGVLAFGAGLFIHDAFTYTEKHIDRVPVSPLALKPERGGPKNLPIVRVQVDDEDDEENARLADKPKLVIVGGGWGVSLSSLPFTKSDINTTGDGRAPNFTCWGISRYSCFIGNLHNLHTAPSMYVTRPRGTIKHNYFAHCTLKLLPSVLSKFVRS